MSTPDTGIRTDLEWKPLPLAEATALFADAPFRWWVAGGYVLDLHLGRQTREHGDTDIAIQRDDQLALQALLAQDWKLYIAHDYKLTPWQPGYFIPAPIDDIWISKDAWSPWALQVMLVNVVDGIWQYDRLPSIQLSFGETLLYTQDGIPYLRPEIQLLYKGGKPSPMDKAWFDLRTMLPELTVKERTWLRDSLATQFPQGHPWITHIDDYVNAGRPI